jgi:hypothetical protein
VQRHAQGLLLRLAQVTDDGTSQRDRERTEPSSQLPSARAQIQERASPIAFVAANLEQAAPPQGEHDARCRRIVHAQMKGELPQGEAGMLVDRDEDPKLAWAELVAAKAAADRLIDPPTRGGDQEADVLVCPSSLLKQHTVRTLAAGSRGSNRPSTHLLPACLLAIASGCR